MQRQSTIIIAEWIRIHHVVLDFKGKYENHRIDQKHARDRLAAAGGSHLRGSRWWQPRPWQPLVAATLATDGRQGGGSGSHCGGRIMPAAVGNPPPARPARRAQGQTIATIGPSPLSQSSLSLASRSLASLRLASFSLASFRLVGWNARFAPVSALLVGLAS